MTGPESEARQKDRGLRPLCLCLRVNSVPVYLLLFVGLFTLIGPVSTAGLERPKYRTAYACEGSTLNMDCDHGHVINLIRANYGRFSITICNEHGNTEWSVNCMSLRSHRVLHDRCSQRQNCSVPASTRGFGDPCPGTLKYLEAHFQCVPVNPTSHTERPRPPWFLATKTTMSTITEDHNTPFPRDPPQAIFPPQEGADVMTKISSSSTTTTIKPPPWLVTNKTSATNSTTSTTTIKSTTTSSSVPTTPSKINVTSSSQAPTMADQVHKVNHTQLESDKSSNEILMEEEENLRKMLMTSTPPSTTTRNTDFDRPGTNSFEPEVSWCPPSSGRGLFWNWTQSGQTATQSCPGGASGDATRPCSGQGWASPPDLGMCRSVWLTTLLTRAEDKDSVLAIAQDLTQVTQSRQLYGGDITAAARLVSELTERMGEDVSSFPDGAQLEALVTELVTKALTTVSNLVGRQRLAWGDLRASEHNYAITKLLLGLEEAAFFLADNIHHEKIITHGVSNILMRLQVLETRNVGPITFPSDGDPWPSEPSSKKDEKEIPEDSTRHLQDFITLPPEALLENSENGLVKMVFFSYQGLQRLLQPDTSYRYIDSAYKTGNGSRILNSRVLSASLGAGRHIQLSEPVYITFAMLQTVNVTNPACVFWDYTTSSWSEEGCRVVRFNTSHTTCQCDHLTNFAVLMDIHSNPMTDTHQLALSIITYVGCIISIVCLLLATVVFHAFRALKNDRTTIHKNLCICLMLGEAIFVGGISRTDQPLVCSVVAGFLQYFFLAAFAWMFLEGFQLYIMLSEVFEAEKSRSRWYYATAYGVPAFIVAVSAIIDPYSYGTETVCWLRTDNYFIFAFVGPVLLVLLANSVFLTLSLVLMCRHAHNSAVLKNKETSRLASLRSWIRGAIILMFLLGLTWTFGLLYLDRASVAMAYVFTILNSLQGLFIFVFHCLQNEKVKKEMRRVCGRHSWFSLCYSTPAKNNNESTRPPVQSQNSLVSGLSAGRWRRRSSAEPGREVVLPATLTGRGSLLRASQLRQAGLNASIRHALTPKFDGDEEKYSFKSCGRDSGHGGSEQEDSPRTGPQAKLSSLRLNNNVTPRPANDHSQLVNPFAAAAALESNNAILPDYRFASDVSSLRYPTMPGMRVATHRNQSPWNHTYTEIADGIVVRPRESTDPVYEEIEREGRSEIQVSDLSDEDGRRQSSDISRQSSRSYGDHRPLLPYTLPDRSCGGPSLSTNDPRFASRFRSPDPMMSDGHGHNTMPAVSRLHPGIDHTIVSAGHMMPTMCSSHAPSNGQAGTPIDPQQYQEAMMAALGHGPVVQPLSEPNLRSWEAVQRHRDLQQLQHLGEMTVAVLNGEQVVCKLKSPLAPIHENSAAAQQTVAATCAAPVNNSERYLAPQTYSHC